jgi:6-pyruvoyltetrahydropterin/6-carboxytetrahydropterin synthase
MYTVTKTYGHDLGLSAAFRQWRAESHCRCIHGYALAISVKFESETLDIRNWVVDFGALKGFKESLVELFDHKLIVAMDDPQLSVLENLGALGIAQVIVVPHVGCEAFAKMTFELAEDWLRFTPEYNAVRVRSVEVREHGSNAASYERSVA